MEKLKQYINFSPMLKGMIIATVLPDILTKLRERQERADINNMLKQWENQNFKLSNETHQSEEHQHPYLVLSDGNDNIIIIKKQITPNEQLLYNPKVVNIPKYGLYYAYYY